MRAGRGARAASPDPSRGASPSGVRGPSVGETLAPPRTLRLGGSAPGLTHSGNLESRRQSELSPSMTGALPGPCHTRAGLSGKSPPGHTPPPAAARAGEHRPLHGSGAHVSCGRAAEQPRAGSERRGAWKGDSRGQSLPEDQPGSRGDCVARSKLLASPAGRVPGGGVWGFSHRAWTSLERWVLAYCSWYLLGTERRTVLAEPRERTQQTVESLQWGRGN